MSCKNSGVSHKTDCVKLAPSIGDIVRWGIIPCRVVGVFGDVVYLVVLSRFGLPVGEVLTAPASELFSYRVGTSISFRLHDKIVRGRVRSYDVFGRCVVRLDDEFFEDSPIRVFHLSTAELLDVA